MMKIIGIKITKDPASTKVLYIKNNNMYVRSGADDFAVGKSLQGSYTHLTDRFGFCEVENPPIFSSSEDIRNNISRFHMKNNGMAQYTK